MCAYVKIYGRTPNCTQECEGCMFWNEDNDWFGEGEEDEDGEQDDEG